MGPPYGGPIQDSTSDEAIDAVASTLREGRQLAWRPRHIRCGRVTASPKLPVPYLDSRIITNALIEDQRSTSEFRPRVLSGMPLNSHNRVGLIERSVRKFSVPAE